MDESTLPTVILGAGFTGLFAALHLCHRRYPRPIVLIDQAERFVFKPLLYELLSGEMTDTQVQPRYAELFECDSVTFVQDQVQAIDLRQRRVNLTSGLHYDYGNLLLGLGSVTNFFDIQGAEKFAFPFRTGEDTIALRRHLRECLQCASQAKDANKRQTFLTVAIVGAGPSGIEMAATLADLLPQWYTRLGGDLQEIRIVVFNRSQEILKGDLNGDLREIAHRALQTRSTLVEVVSNALVKVISENSVEYEQAQQTKVLQTNTIIWTAGTGLHPLIESLQIAPEMRDRAGRLRVASTMQLPEFPEVFVGGDCAVLEKPLPATAQVAYQQGAMIAQNLHAIAQGQSPKPVTVALRGTLLKLGLGEGVANLFDRVPITGRAGHLVRQGTYLELLPVYVHNFKATVGWLTDELFQRHGRVTPKPRQSVLQRIGDAAAVMVVISSGLLFWRAAQPTSFNQTLRSTHLPALLDQLQQK
ncbi:NAD(P)/FAD-dependent oxidoreductase [Phormidesmis priestleyi ULC007]|uniref:NAD(P)/FAD-dependent oxidoreductase n=1 Tax=Phormidesmis priestleyi ULC007 TaxID=1920490 RepID=A0A2T1D5D1_9CYAN|nr:NAD(P)/FAD-dependent oxidoreductase [Phormidesmis priestleyi]PSB15688.1 NAD(P)/FAD-dependent oxidoreductase [Phormidesmis priestleyi ULC007]PZO45962.1 MAG: NAD(P)/FAD-dependent oxidoreductase [Phormidesmis priestleyi]